MEESAISFIFDSIAKLSELYPEAGWVALIAAILLTLCGIASVATIWMPAPTETSGWYYTLYKWLHVLAAHYKQNKGAKADGSTVEVKAAVSRVMDKR